MKISGKVAIVIGGARGQGRAHCEALLERGAQVCCADLLQDVGQSTEKELSGKYGKNKVFFIICDATKEESIENVFELTKAKFGLPEIVINTVGIMQEFDWRLCVDVNLGSTIRCVEACLKHMSKERGGKGGVFVTTSSISGIKPEDGRPVYSATKFAQNGFIRSWALERNYKKHGIRMSSICTTRVESEFLNQVTSDRIRFADELLDNTEGQGMSPTKVAEGFIRLVEDDTLNGAVMRITVLRGIDIMEYEEQPEY